MKKTQDVRNSKESRDWLATGKSLEWHTCEACRGAKGSRQLEHYRIKIYNLAKQLARNSNSQLVPVARLSRQNALFG